VRQRQALAQRGHGGVPGAFLQLDVARHRRPAAPRRDAPIVGERVAQRGIFRMARRDAVERLLHVARGEGLVEHVGAVHRLGPHAPRARDLREIGHAVRQIRDVGHERPRAPHIHIVDVVDRERVAAETLAAGVLPVRDEHRRAVRGGIEAVAFGQAQRLEQRVEGLRRPASVDPERRVIALLVVRANGLPHALALAVIAEEAGSRVELCLDGLGNTLLDLEGRGRSTLRRTIAAGSRGQCQHERESNVSRVHPAQLQCKRQARRASRAPISASVDRCVSGLLTS
jgi:hypothetical protein